MVGGTIIQRDRFAMLNKRIVIFPCVTGGGGTLVYQGGRDMCNIPTKYFD